ncbi:MAG: integrase [Methyloprofundus sp.]|nr:integrase [Methyloprofundus sp.]
MSTMVVEVYNAFRKAGVPEKEAQDAAEALSNETTATKADIQIVERKMIEIKIIKWMIGLVIVIDAIPFLKNIVA